MFQLSTGKVPVMPILMLLQDRPNKIGLIVFVASAQ